MTFREASGSRRPHGSAALDSTVEEQYLGSVADLPDLGGDAAHVQAPARRGQAREHPFTCGRAGVHAYHDERTGRWTASSTSTNPCRWMWLVLTMSGSREAMFEGVGAG